jgi:LysM repeat protein
MKFFAKLPRIRFKPKRKKMRATVARRSLRAATADYDEMSEPNMKLSRALLIVLLLHVVAVSGIIAFNAIKTRQDGPSLPRSKSSPMAVSAKSDATSSSEADKHEEIRRAHAVGKESGKDRTKGSELARGEQTHKTYVVSKHDTPAGIAKKFKVSYDELLELNRIEDPHKLKIGERLLIPNKSVKGKKANE